MPKFSTRSLQNLGTCDIALQNLFTEVIKHWDCTVTCGFRNEEEQNECFRVGTSNLKWPNSSHNTVVDGIACSRAVDVAPYPIDWKDTDRFYCFSGFVMGIATGMGINIRWGGDWNGNRDLKDQNLFDLPHFELR